MHFRRAGLVQEFHRALQLRAADDGVVHEEELFALDELRHGDLLHLGDLIAHGLIGGQEGARPGRRVLDEGAGKGLAAAVGVADGVGNAGIRHARYIVDLRQAPALHLVARHDLAVAAAHDLHIDALVVGVGVAVVGPEEGADLHVRQLYSMTFGPSFVIIKPK